MRLKISCINKYVKPFVFSVQIWNTYILISTVNLKYRIDSLIAIAIPFNSNKRLGKNNSYKTIVLIELKILIDYIQNHPILKPQNIISCVYQKK